VEHRVCNSKCTIENKVCPNVCMLVKASWF
jgi:hypothetical protein